MKAPILSVLSVLVFAGCANLAPDHQRPEAPVPTQWQDASGADGVAADEIEWRDFFTEPRLISLIDLALANNRDLRTAALDIERDAAVHHLRPETGDDIARHDGRPALRPDDG